jgi:PAS domain S-box-containing protein/putative nucleotidyltransferase with HDIG domain
MAREKVLVVEDEYIVGKNIQMGLESFDYLVPHIATSGETAIELIENEHPDLVLMDIVLRGRMDGIETARAIRSRTDIPVIFLTAYTDEAILERAKMSEPYGYIVKPFEQRELHSAIQIALYRHGMEQKYKESEESYLSLISNIPEVSWIVDNRGKTAFISPNVKKVLGYTSGEIFRDTTGLLLKKIHPEDAVGFTNAYLALFRDKVPLDFTCRVEKKDGELVWVHIQGTPLTGHDEADSNGALLFRHTGLKKTDPGIGKHNGRVRKAYPRAHDSLDRDRGWLGGLKTLTREIGASRLGNSSFWTRPSFFQSRASSRKSMDAAAPNATPSSPSASLKNSSSSNLCALFLLRDITESRLSEERLIDTLAKLRTLLGKVIQTMALTIEKRDPYTAGHQRRVADLARYIAKEMGLLDAQIDGIRMAGLIHDLGKIAVPAELLSKPYHLNEIEFQMIKTHPAVGYDILKSIDFPLPIDQIVYQHHERINGSGYPQGLSGNEILLESKILAVADVVEAIASHRPYRPALGIHTALREISQNRGVLYDSETVNACLRVFGEKKFHFS